MLYHHMALLVIVLIASSGVFLAIKLAVSMNERGNPLYSAVGS